MGVQKLYPILKSNFWWPGMFRDLEMFIKGCTICQANQAPNNSITPISANIKATRRMEVISIDALALPSVAQVTTYCITVVDHVTRFAWALVVQDLQATTVLNALKSNIFCVFGWPEILLSDNGTEFKNALLNDICEQAGTERRFTTAYHPQTNGLTERMNRTIMGLLRKTVETVDDWPLRLPEVILAYNSTPVADAQTPTDTPFCLMFGRYYPLPLAAKLGYTTPDLTEGDNQQAITDIAMARDERLMQQAEIANKDRKPFSHFEIGQIVWKHDNAVVSSATHNRQEKLSPKWIGLFVIVRLPSVPVAVVRALGGATTQTVNVSQLKPFLTQKGEAVQMHASQIHRIDEIEESQTTIPETVEDDSQKRRSTRIRQKRKSTQEKDENTYVVSKILSHRIAEDGIVSFKVQWEVEGTSISWEPEDNLNCPFLVRDYFKSKVPFNYAI
jgi:hypothetical protein